MIIEQFSTCLPLPSHILTSVYAVVLNLYLVYPGLSYIQKTNTTADDEIIFGAEVLVADHPNAIQDYLIDVSFAIKVCLF